MHDSDANLTARNFPIILLRMATSPGLDSSTSSSSILEALRLIAHTRRPDVRDGWVASPTSVGEPEADLPALLTDEGEACEAGDMERVYAVAAE